MLRMPPATRYAGRRGRHSLRPATRGEGGAKRRMRGGATLQASKRRPMRLIDYLDKGAMLGADSPCLTMGETDLSYRDVQRLTHRVARALQRSGVKPGDKVAVLSGNDAIAFACVFAISRAGAVWCPISPRKEAAENRFILDAFDCAA